MILLKRVERTKYPEIAEKQREKERTGQSVLRMMTRREEKERGW
jgi:hypothetical protein